MSHQHQPENALKRAAELIAIGNKKTALNTLQDVFSGQRRYKQWRQVYEDIMLQFLSLCLELKDFHNMKEGLYQYRQLCMQSSVYGSLDKVARYLLNIAEAKAVATFDAAQVELTATDVSFEDEEMIPSDSVMLMATTAEGLRDRTAQETWVPWVKFLWESYRSIIETLKVNSKLEATYHATARAAFSFCLRFRRTSEFRRLCDVLRMHLHSLEKMSASGVPVTESKSRRPWEGWSERSIERQLQTKFDQLEAGSELGMWNETFKTMDDINKIMTISRVKFKNKQLDGSKRARLMATFYDKLKRIFWLTDNKLFHAYTWNKFHTLCRDYNKALSEDALKMQASSVVLAALSISPELEVEESSLILGGADAAQVEAERDANLAGMINFNSTTAPSRSSILRELGTRGVMEKAIPQVQKLFALLEKAKEPLGLVEKVAPLLEDLEQISEAAKEEAIKTGASLSIHGAASLAKSSVNMKASEDGVISDDAEDVAAEKRAAEFIMGQTLHTKIDLVLYLEPIRRVLVLRLLQQLSSVYATVRLRKLYELTERLGLSELEVEDIILKAVSKKHIRAFIDHRSQCLRFPSAGDIATVGETAAAKATRDEAMRGQLTALAGSLRDLCVRLESQKPPLLDADARSAFMDRIRESIPLEHKDILGRKAIIEARKEKLEREEQEKREAEAAQRREREQRQQVQEEERLRQEEAERQRRLREKIEKQAQVEQLKKAINDQGGAKEILAEADKPLEAMEIQELQELAIKQKQQAREKLMKEQQELVNKAKRVDYIARALRDAEIPLLKEKDEKTRQERMAAHERDFSDFVENEKARHQSMLDKRRELLTVFPNIFDHVRNYAESRMGSRREVYEAQYDEARDEAFRREHTRRITRAREMKDREEERLRLEEEAERRAAEQKREDERIAKEKQREAAAESNKAFGELADNEPDDDDDIDDDRYDGRSAHHGRDGFNMDQNVHYDDDRPGDWRTAGGAGQDENNPADVQMGRYEDSRRGSRPGPGGADKYAPPSARADDDSQWRRPHQGGMDRGENRGQSRRGPDRFGHSDDRGPFSSTRRRDFDRDDGDGPRQIMRPKQRGDDRDYDGGGPRRGYRGQEGGDEGDRGGGYYRHPRDGDGPRRGPREQDGGDGDGARRGPGGSSGAYRPPRRRVGGDNPPRTNNRWN